MSIGYPRSWVSNRTTLDESKSMSKAVRRYGKDGSRLDSTYGSTGGNSVHESELPPSVGARHVGHIGPARIEQVGHATDGSGRFIAPTFDKGLIGGAIETHPALKPEGLRHSASGGKFGKPSRVPVGKNESYRGVGDAGALAGDSQPRVSYSGGKGPIGP